MVGRQKQKEIWLMEGNPATVVAVLSKSARISLVDLHCITRGEKLTRRKTASQLPPPTIEVWLLVLLGFH